MPRQPTDSPTPANTSKKRTWWHEVFLKALRSTGNVRAATNAVGINRCTAYEHRERYPAFAEAWDEALEDSTDALELEARKTALGLSEPVLDSKGNQVVDPHTGQPIMIARKRDTIMMIFLLKGLRPEKYRDNFPLKQIVDELQRAQQIAGGGAQGAAKARPARRKPKPD